MLTDRCSPVTVAPGSTVGSLCVTRLPPIVAPERTTTSPLKTTTSLRTSPAISTGPLNTTSDSRTVPSMIAGPSKITAAPAVSPSATRRLPCSTIWSSSSDPLPAVCAVAGAANTAAITRKPHTIVAPRAMVRFMVPPLPPRSRVSPAL